MTSSTAAPAHAASKRSTCWCTPKPDDFLHGGAGTALKSGGRKRFIAAFERRLVQETTHPVFGYRLTMRRLIEVQGRLFGRYLMGEIKEYPHYLPR